MKAKKLFTGLICVAILLSNTITFAAEIPHESVPDGATDECVAFVETLISDVLDEVKAGAGYGQVWYKANNAILNAIYSRKSNSYGYGIMAPIARNAIIQYRDMYLRPEYYIESEEYVSTLIADIIESYKSGEIDYNTARKEGYIKILKAKNPSFEPMSCYMTDFCYWDIPAVDTVKFTMVRKLLLE